MKQDHSLWGRGGQLLARHRALLLYALFGVLTTAVNLAVYWAAAHPLGLGVLPSAALAWVLAVLFAYLTNRTWVFHSRAESAAAILRELISFFSCRLATGLLDGGCMFLFVDLLGWNDMLIKTAANLLVIILNYLASKLFIFKKN